MKAGSSAEKLSSLQKQSSYAKLLINAIQLHVQSKGAISTILNVLDELKAEQDHNLTEAQAYIERLHAYYPPYLASIQSTIDGAQAEIDRAVAKIAELTAERAAREAEKAERESELSANRAQQAEATADREAEHAEYQTNKQEHEELITGVDEVVPEIEALFADYRPSQADAAAPAMIQLKSTQTKLQKLVANFKNKQSKLSPLLVATLEVTANSEYFSDGSKV
jgi:chromosome segregation ATPase